MFPHIVGYFQKRPVKYLGFVETVFWKLPVGMKLIQNLENFSYVFYSVDQIIYLLHAEGADRGAGTNLGQGYISHENDKFCYK